LGGADDEGLDEPVDDPPQPASRAAPATSTTASFFTIGLLAFQ
jgi:hypothetical protein